MTHLIFKEIWKFSACFVFLRNFGSSFVSSNYLTQNQVMAKLTNFRSSRREVFCKKGVLRNFTKFIGKHLYQSLFFNKVAGLRPATSLKKRLWYKFFPVNFVKFQRTPFFTEHVWWLLLPFSYYLCFFVYFQKYSHWGVL